MNWLIIGLGNPGERYADTPHNLGFMVVDYLAQEAGAQVKREECRALIGRAEIENEIVELAKPQTFMNLSGEAVAGLLQKRPDARILAITDDLALPFGKIRLRPKGSDGGHNGLKSIAACLKTQDYVRLRIGVQPEHPISDAKRYVLDKFSKSQAEAVEQTLKLSAEAIRSVLRDGLEKAMAKFN